MLLSRVANVGLHPAILSPNLGRYTGRRGTRTRRSTWPRDHLDGVYIPTSVALIFLAQEKVPSNVRNCTVHANSRA